MYSPVQGGEYRYYDHLKQKGYPEFLVDKMSKM
uniref:Uncharacterized protein n=1 Tax=Escherichia coli TaxID=562 RepID=A0A7G8AJJ1_ECOLX|nr:hypothetical protein HPHBBJMH_00147 [Escherichia coli]UTV02010.1 hypothetical protein CDLCKJJP_00003 [Escherichia coli]